MTSPALTFVRDLWRLTKPYWFSEEKVSARLLLAAVIGLTLGMVYMNVQLNQWNNAFFTMLQKRQGDQFMPLMTRFTVLAIIYIAMAIYSVYLRQALQIRWRRWLTDRYLSEWLGDRTYYRMQVTGNQTDNPDQRISEDLNLFVDNTLKLSLGLLNAVVTLVSFVGILWVLSGTYEFNWNGTTYEIYGGMVWVALAYAFIGSWLAHLIGRRLIPLNFEQQKYEADFRFGLARFRENTESVALYRGEPDEYRGFTERFGVLSRNWWAIMKRTKLFNMFSTGYDQAAIIFPYLVAAPRYLAGKLELGDLTQTAGAFAYVQGSLSWFINFYTGSGPGEGFVGWKATVDRLTGFHNAIAAAKLRAQEEPGITMEPTSGTDLSLDSIDLEVRNGERLLSAASATIAPGERVLVRGASGSGKSTLFRAIAGIWPFGHGRIRVPAGFDALFLPQRPYFPLGTLRDAIVYPAAPESVTEERLLEAMHAVGLDTMVDRLDEKAIWSQQLSGGEQQRVAFARALLLSPRWLFLDEATSNLDAVAEQKLYTLLTERLKDTAIISIAHRPEIAAFHDRVLTLDAEADTLVETSAPA